MTTAHLPDNVWKCEKEFIQETLRLKARKVGVLAGMSVFAKISILSSVIFKSKKIHIALRKIIRCKLKVFIKTVKFIQHELDIARPD